MSNKKYELTDEIIIICGRTLHRIRALRSFGDVITGVKKGDLGGFVEGEKNLSHRGTCWVYDEAMVFDKARVIESAKVIHNALVYDEAIISKKAIVENFAQVYDRAILSDYAIAANFAKVGGRAIIKDSAVVFEHAMVYGKVFIGGKIWLGGHSEVFENAEILIASPILFLRNEARIRGDARIYSIKDIVTICPLGSKGGTLTAYRSKKRGGIELNEEQLGFQGTIDEFTFKVVYENWNDNVYLEQCQAAIAFIKNFFKINKNRGKHG